MHFENSRSCGGTVFRFLNGKSLELLKNRIEWIIVGCRFSLRRLVGIKDESCA